MAVQLRSPAGRNSQYASKKGNEEIYTPGSSVLPPHPETLGREGQKRWKMLCSTLISKQMLSPDFFHSLEHVCRAYDFLEQLNKQIAMDGITVVTHLGTKPNPLLKDKLNTMILIRAFLADFGLTPSSSRNSNVPIANVNKQQKSVSSRKDDDDPF